MSNNELQENWVSETTASMLAFLGGEFGYVKDHTMNVREAVGWSGTFMKCGLAAFLLLLLESDSMQQGESLMCSQVVDIIGFTSQEYQKGTLKTISDTSQTWFWKCFCHWKETIMISDTKKNEYLDWIESLVMKRVEGIMEGNHRKYYHECAGYVAALGEVRESRGENCGKQNVMLKYKNLYSRRRAFHEELRALGMKDGKK